MAYILFYFDYLCLNYVILTKFSNKIYRIIRFIYFNKLHFRNNTVFEILKDIAEIKDIIFEII
jgi:hypothetical protein